MKMFRRYLIHVLCRSIERHPRYGLTLLEEGNYEAWLVPTNRKEQQK